MNPGTRLNHYEIVEQLGKGGMGEVYRARDTELGRDVAVKLLPRELAEDPERLARLRQEARSLAALSHPGIATVHGLEEDDGTRFIVMELVEGPTVSERLRDEALPIEEALEIALRIAKALEAAHRRGLVHRDLKPDNVKVTPEGGVKLLDFGLAKASPKAGRPGAATSADVTSSPTVAETRAGTILGTAAYMSPEQARGDDVDARSDIWAFGCVLYEMLAGVGPFHRETVSDTLAAVLKDEPDWSLLPDATPVAVRRLLRRCLEKDRTDRLQHIGDARLEIQEVVAGDVVEDEPSTVRAASTARVWTTALAVSALGAVLGALLYASLVTPGGEPTRPAHLELLLDPPVSAIGVSVPFAVSRDGRHLVHEGQPAELTRLYLRDLHEARQQARVLPGPESNVYAPFFSPDGEWVAFQTLADYRLMKLQLATGVVRPIADAVGAIFGGSWGNGGNIAFIDNLGVLWHVSADGGTPRPVVRPTATTSPLSGSMPRLLPDGRRVLITVQEVGGQAPHIEVVSLDTGSRQRIGPGSDPHYVPTPTGHLVYVEGGSLTAAPFDVDAAEIVGTPVPLPYRPAGIDGARWFDISDDGWLFYAAPEHSPRAELVWTDRSGANEAIGGSFFGFPAGPRISPDGGRIAYGGGGPPDIRVIDTSGQREISLTRDPHLDMYPLWLNDGRDLVYMSNRPGGDFKLFTQPADGSDEPTLLLETEHPVAPTSVSPDSRLLAFYEVHPDTLRDLWILDMEENRAFEYLVTPANERGATFSPDGKWLAYVSDRDGSDQVYVKPYPDEGTLYQVSTDGGTGPIWGPDGREILYARGGALMRAEFTAEPEVSVRSPEILLEGPYTPDPFGNAGADIAPDGRHLVLLSRGTGNVSRLQVVTGWFAELERSTR